MIVDLVNLERDAVPLEWIGRVAIWFGVTTEVVHIGYPAALNELLRRAGAGFAAATWICDQLGFLEVSDNDALLRDALCRGSGRATANPLVAVVDKATRLGPARPVRFVSPAAVTLGETSFPGPGPGIILAEASALIGWDFWLGWYVGALGEGGDLRLMEDWLSLSKRNPGAVHAAQELFNRLCRADAVDAFTHWFLETRRYDRLATVLTAIDASIQDPRGALLRDLLQVVGPDLDQMPQDILAGDPFRSAHRLGSLMQDAVVMAAG